MFFNKKATQQEGVNLTVNNGISWPSIILGIVLAILAMVGLRYLKPETNSASEYNSDLIQEQIKNVGKLVVTEGHFSQIMTYKDQEKYLMGLYTAEKKAIIVINANVTVAYDLHQMKYDIDEKNKTITIVNIPKEEIKISPDIQFYNVEQNQFNPFTGEDYNKINQKVKADLARKMEHSRLKTNAQNRLISELSKILILTNTMGWKLQYNGQNIETESDFGQKLKL